MWYMYILVYFDFTLTTILHWAELEIHLPPSPPHLAKTPLRASVYRVDKLTLERRGIWQQERCGIWSQRGWCGRWSHCLPGWAALRHSLHHSLQEAPWSALNDTAQDSCIYIHRRIPKTMIKRLRASSQGLDVSFLRIFTCFICFSGWDT